MRNKRFSAKQFVEGEIDVMIDGYGNDEAYAIDFVFQQLCGDEYRDQLSDKQTAAAIAYLSNRRKKTQIKES